MAYALYPSLPVLPPAVYQAFEAVSQGPDTDILQDQFVTSFFTVSFHQGKRQVRTAQP